MSADPLLSELCAICHLDWPKYKCPRCTIQTCSLPCVKRHKLWSQCTGIRDPATYRKRRELATACSVDRDYNFITKVERAIAGAGEEVEERGIALGEGRTKLIKGQARRDATMHQRAAIVLKAPRGMSRALQNQSKWDKRKKRFTWTVEWVLEDGSRLLDNCPETRTVKDAFTNVFGKHKGSRQHSTLSKSSTMATSTGSETVNAVSSGSARPDQIDSNAATHFYLHRPNLPSDVSCVIPILSEAALKEVVHDRVLVEFPTIYVLTVPKERLQSPFITEEQYIGRHAMRSPTVIPETQAEASAELEPMHTREAYQSLVHLDEQHLTDALHKDLGS